MKFFNPLAAGLCVFLSPANCIIAQDEATGSPLEEVTQNMKVAADRLAKRTTDSPTQKSQDEAIAKLDLLIAELEKERSGMGNSSSPNPSRPANNSNVRSGPGGMGELHGTRMQGDRWGELPPHERDRILQSLTEGFPPHYQAVLEAYYKRLAVEKRAANPDTPVDQGKASKPGLPASAPATPGVPAAAKPTTPLKSTTPVKKNAQ